MRVRYLSELTVVQNQLKGKAADDKPERDPRRLHSSPNRSKMAGEFIPSSPPHHFRTLPEVRTCQKSQFHENRGGIR